MAGKHIFGGPWTEIKLDAVEYYLECYTKALKYAGFNLWYIDAFAGSGDRESLRETGGIFEGAPIETIRETLAGSARRALSVRPPFDHYVFIEKDEIRCEALAETKAENPDVDIRIIRGEANEELQELVKAEPWRRRDTIRQLAHDFKGIGPKAAMLDRVLGPEWRELYSIKPEHQPTAADMFAIFDDAVPPIEPELQRVVSQKQFEQWLKDRLREEFPFVSEPLPLLASPNRQLFSLFLGVSNPSRPLLTLRKSSFATSIRILHLGHLVVGLPIERAPCGFFIFAAPLLEEERRP
jgi:hypothetical protein